MTSIPARQRFLLAVEGDVITESKGVAPGACVVDPNDAVALRTFIHEYVPLAMLPHVIKTAQERLT